MPCNFGLPEISSNADLICVWSLKIHKDKDCSTIIGIASNQNINRSFHDHPHYTFWSGEKNSAKFLYGWSPCCKEFKEGDTVSMHLDLKRALVKLIINGDDQGVSVGNVAKSKKI